MKKWISILLICAMVLALLAGCGGDAKDNGDDSGNPTTAATDPTTKATDPTTEATDPSSEPTDPTEPAAKVKVHARIPADWGTAPCFWAWKMADNTNAFTAWPGEPMTANGDWYEIEIPDWCDGVIVNDGGSNQTVDLQVEAGKEVWLDVYAGDNVVISYTQPGDREASVADTGLVGLVADGAYGNSAFDLLLTPEDGWVFFTDKELAEQNGLTSADQLAEQFEDAIDKGGSLIVMMCANAAGESVNLVVQKTDSAVKGMDQETFCNQMAATMEQLYASMGYDVEVTAGTTTFQGESANVICSNLVMSQKQLFIIQDEYTCIITATGETFERADAIMAMFDTYAQ